MTTLDADRRTFEPAPETNAETWPRWRRIAFRTLVGVVAVAGLPLYVFGLAEVVLMWLSDTRLLDVVDDLGLADLRFRAQFFHLGIVAWTLFPSMLAQLRKPHRRVAPALQGLSVAVTAAVVMAASGALDVMDLVMVAIFGAVAWLHPRRASITARPQFDSPQTQVAGVGAVGWSVLAGSYAVRAWEDRGLPGAVDLEAQYLWANSAVMAMAIVVVSLIGATRHRGWQLPAVSASLGGVAVGAHALAHPDQAASMGSAPAVVAIVWGVSYGVATVRRMRRRARA